jgi:hypothetical protein
MRHGRNTILILGATVVALACLAGSPRAGLLVAVQPLDPPSPVSIGLGLKVDSTRVSLDGFLICRDDSATVRLPSRARVVLAGSLDEFDGRVHCVSLLAGPNVGDCMQRLTAVARVMRSVSRIAVRRWWQQNASPFHR